LVRWLVIVVVFVAVLFAFVVVDVIAAAAVTSAARVGVSFGRGVSRSFAHWSHPSLNTVAAARGASLLFLLVVAIGSFDLFVRSSKDREQRSEGK
jgi:hypothetical protein